MVDTTTVAEQATRPRAGYTGNLLTVVFSAWLLGGAMTDVWAHNNVPKLETFFTPWHAALYSGFLATAAWTCWLVRRNLVAGARGAAAVPVGYGYGLAGVALFLVAGAGDLTWHTIFGIERNSRIFFSPTHLLLIAAAVLIFTSPLRDAWSDPALPDAPSLRRLLPAVLGVGFAAAAAMVLLQFADLLTRSPKVVTGNLEQVTGSAATGVAQSLLITNLALLLPLLLLARRWRPPFGAATVLFAVVGLLAEVTHGFGTPLVFVAVLLGGVAVDVLALRLRSVADPVLAYRILGGVAPVITWAVYFAVVFASAGKVPSVVEYWTGLPVMAGLLGLLFAVLLRPGRSSVAR